MWGLWELEEKPADAGPEGSACRSQRSVCVWRNWCWLGKPSNSRTWNEKQTFFFFDRRRKRSQASLHEPCCQTRATESKSQLKTIRVRLFSLEFEFPLAALGPFCFGFGVVFFCFFCIFSWNVADGCSNEEVLNRQWWKDTLDVWSGNSETPLRPCRGTESPGSGPDPDPDPDRITWLTGSPAHILLPLTDMMEWLLPPPRAATDFSPSAEWKPFSSGFSCPALAPALLSSLFLPILIS